MSSLCWSQRSIVLSAAMATSLIAGCTKETGELPPHAEALVIVDTDLPVPQLASRLRVDLYTEDGTWFESRDIGRPDPRDWPASFSVFSDDDTRERHVLVRLRVHPDGITRDYKGERYEPRLPYTPPRVLSSLADLCANAPELPLNGHLTLRMGAQKLTDIVQSDRCPHPVESGSTAARVTIPTRGRYRFFVSNAFSYNTYVSLSLRTRCEDPSSQTICQSEPRGQAVFSPGHFPRFDADLDVGTYYLLTTGEVHDWAADLTVEVMPSDIPIPPSDPVTSTAPFAPDVPRLEDPNGTRNNATALADATPRSEPLPSATVDRLLALRLIPGVRGRARVTLRGACSGTMARLGTLPRKPDPKTAETCVDTEGVRVRVEDMPLEQDMTRPSDTVVGTFGRGDECPPPSTTDDPQIVCVPGGVFLFGSRSVTLTTATAADSAPERTAVMPRFWIDREEVTNKRLRDAIAAGFQVDPKDVFERDILVKGPPGVGPPDPEHPFESFCTWTRAPLMGHEDSAVSCVNWSLARAFCQAHGGDLPTEAEWEYAASAAGRALKTQYPWGDSEPTCEGVVMSRNIQLGGGSSVCIGLKQSSGPATAVADGLSDITSLGIHGLGGNLSEFTLDSGLSFTHPCWSSAPLISPRCIEPDAPMHVARGGSWQTSPTTIASRLLVPSGMAAHGIEGTASAIPGVGFRCAYRERPTR